MSEELKMLLTIGGPIAAIGLSYGGMRTLVKGLQREIGALGDKVTSLEASKATTAQVQALEGKLAAGDGARSQFDVAIATLRSAQEELKQKHAEGIGDLRNRAATLESRTSSVEQGAAELRAQMNSLTQAVARVEAKQDREASALEQIRRDLLEFVVNPGRR